MYPLQVWWRLYRTDLASCSSMSDRPKEMDSDKKNMLRFTYPVFHPSMDVSDSE